MIYVSLIFLILVISLIGAKKLILLEPNQIYDFLGNFNKLLRKLVKYTCG
jgi:hypothetical protein